VNLGATLRDNVGSVARDVRVRDLGLGGASLEVLEGSGGARFLTPEAIVTVELAAPTRWDPLTLQGKVVWVRRSPQGRTMRAGVRFEHRDAAALFALFQLLGATAYDL
jgi:hypothetical protein